MRIDNRERATILAALRHYQNARDIPGAIEDIATNCGEFRALESPDIDELCEFINTED